MFKRFNALWKLVPLVFLDNKLFAFGSFEGASHSRRRFLHGTSEALTDSTDGCDTTGRRAVQSAGGRVQSRRRSCDPDGALQKNFLVLFVCFAPVEGCGLWKI